MSSGAHGTAPVDGEQPLWRFIRLDDYKPPSAAARSVAAGAWASARELFGGRKKDFEKPLKEEADLRALQEVRLAHIVRPIDWRNAVDALDSALDGWHEKAPPRPTLRVVVGPPHGGIAEIVAQWGERHAAHRIEAPGVAQILSRSADGSGRDLPAGLWVLPRLEHSYLRHTDGLALVRRLLQQATDGDAGPGLIGCDSWAWAYLRHVWSGPMPEALTLQPFDGLRLARLLAGLAAPVEPAGVYFRNARTGNDVLAVPRQPTADDEISEDIARIAVHCRGNPGTARIYWRQSLRDVPELTEQAAPAADGPDAGSSDDRTATSHRDVVWVSAKGEVPTTPSEVGEDTALVLHALLIHGGLPATTLPTLLPMASHHTSAVLLRLKALELVACGADDRWHVAPLGYAAVRELLHARGYLTDSL